jgi:hypothetical protein
MTVKTQEKAGTIIKYIQCIFTIVLIISIFLFTPMFSNINRIENSVERIDRI